MTVGPADPPGDLAGLGGVGGEAVIGDGDAGTLDHLAGLVLEESHRGAEAYTQTLCEAGAPGRAAGGSAQGPSSVKAGRCAAVVLPAAAIALSERR